MANNDKQAHADVEFEGLLEHLRRTRGFDFGAYKRASLMRRIEKRMQTVKCERFADYQDYLEVHPDEFAHLFDTLLINVTGFFRDPAAWDHLASDVVPRILSAKSDEAPVRVWSAGCASGEEAYTVAMVLAEALGQDGFRDRVKIYASDLDEKALNQARQGVYGHREIAGIPPAQLEKYFEYGDQRYTFRKDLRRNVIFGRHDLLQDAPISRIDLLLCRNVLMYFNAEAQGRILSRFHFALNENGFLFLGKAEMLFTHASLFTPTDMRRRVFARVPKVTLRERLLLMAQSGNSDVDGQISRHTRFREAAVDASPIAQVIIDLNGFLALANERARILLGVSGRDLGKSLFDLQFAYRIPELQARIEEVYLERRPAVLKDIDWDTTSGGVHTLEVQVAPLLDVNGALLGAAVSFNDISRYKRLQLEIEHANQELETAYEELQSTNEELETTNEELQSTVEELETTNEELQSTNEELETMNEELQSTNEELQAINDELRRRTDELNQANAFLEAVLTGIRGAVAVMDAKVAVQVWNHRATEMWGLLPTEVRGQNFLNLDIGLPLEPLRPSIRGILHGEMKSYETTLDAVNRRGKPFRCHVNISPLLDGQTAVTGIILVMEAAGATDGGA